MDKHLKTRKHTAGVLIITGIVLICGSTGACENEACSLLQYIFCCACGTALVFAGREIGKEG